MKFSSRVFSLVKLLMVAIVLLFGAAPLAIARPVTVNPVMTEAMSHGVCACGAHVTSQSRAGPVAGVSLQLNPRDYQSGISGS